MAPVTTAAFGAYVLSLPARTLTHHGAEVRLTPKAFDLLSLLVRRAPDAVSKADIYAELWPDTHVSEVSIAALVFEVRNALGESARAPRRIRTVHGFGYAFTTDEQPGALSRFVLMIDGRAHPVAEGVTVLGRAVECDIRLDSTKVSRRHARVLVDGASARVEDCGSANGTWLNGRQIAGTAEMQDGDALRFGGVNAVLRVYAPDVETERAV